MRLDEIRNLPTVVSPLQLGDGGVHESTLRAYNILEKVTHGAGTHAHRRLTRRGVRRYCRKLCTPSSACRS